MTITSLSFTLVNTYAPQTSKAATAVERKSTSVQAEDAGCQHERPASRQNRFADAMMSALRELGFGGTAAAAASVPATAATSAATTTATAASAPSESVAVKGSPATVEAAVQQFAHALFQALRQNGSSDKKADDGGDRVEGHGQHRHHQHRRHGEGQGYGNLSQRLESLSQTIGAPAVTAAPAAPAAAGTVTTPVATPAAAPAKNPLLDAFTKLFNTLKPASTATPATDMAEKLRLFLHTLAQSLAPDTMGSVQRAQVGGMLNVSA